MQNCLNFSVDRSEKAKHATHPHPGPPLAPGDTVPAGHKREGENQSSSRRHCPKFRQQMPPRRHANNGATVSTRTVSPGPLRGAEQRRLGGGRRLALSEPQASFASRPPNRVAQGTGQRPAPTQGRLFCAYFLLAKQKKVRRASSAENTAKRSQQKTHPHPGHPLAPGDTVPTGHKREGENRCTPRRPCPKFRQPIDSRLRGNDGATVSDRLVSPAPLRGAPQ